MTKKMLVKELLMWKKFARYVGKFQVISHIRSRLVKKSVIFNFCSYGFKKSPA